MSQRIKIVYLITELDIGGAEKCLYQLATRLDRTRFDPCVACLSGHGAIGEWLETRGIPVHYIRANTWADAATAVLRVAAILRRERARILHTFLFHANVVGRLAGFVARTPVVISSVRVAEQRRHHLWLEGLTCGLTNFITCVSEAVRQHMIRHAGMPPGRLVTIPNGVEAPSSLGRPDLVRSSLGLRADQPVATIIGRLTPQKGIDDCLAAAAIVARALPEAHFVIVGDGPLKGELEALASSLGIAERTHFLGWRENVWDVLGASNVLVSGSRWEGLPNVILEAMAVGCPVVATGAGGCGEVVSHGTTGFIVPTGDIESLAGAVSYLLREPSEARGMGLAGREAVLSRFGVGRMVSSNQALYESALRHN
ncbi:MAG: glycosyltransferase [Planctomycetes bacterium]|nr:glycosyltransferase [Planctomycetota bacterium]